MTIRADDKLSSTFHILQNEYRKNIRISDFYVIFLFQIIVLSYTSDRVTDYILIFIRNLNYLDYYYPISLLEGKYGII